MIQRLEMKLFQDQKPMTSEEHKQQPVYQNILRESKMIQDSMKCNQTQ